jgi:hypothetical protein
MRTPPLLAATLFLLIAAAPPVPVIPALAVLNGGFTPGRWEVRSVDSPKGPSRTLCIASAEAFLMGGRSGQCRFTIISDGPSEAVVTYRCDGGLSGRTDVRRDTAGLYTLGTQGVERGLPFGAREEWRRTGTC